MSEIALQIYGGGTPKTTNEEFWKGNIPWIQSSDLIEERLFNVKPRKYISQEATSKSATKLVPQNSIAIVTRVGVGKLAFMPFSYATSQDFLSLSELKIEPEFAVYALYKMMQLVSNEVQGTSIKGITKDELLAKEFLIPGGEEQKKIGVYLHNLDHLITLHQRKCDQAKKLKKYMLQKMFPKNNESVPEIRFEGFSNDWEQRKVSELCSISTGKSNTQDKVEDGEYPFYVRSPIIERSTKYLYDEEAVLTVGDGVGTGKVFHYVNGKYDLHQRCYRMYDFTDGLNAHYFYHTFSKLFYKRVMAMTAKTSVDSVRLEMIADMKIPTPQIDEQVKIGTYFDNLDHLITLHQKKCDQLKNLKKFMLQNMFV